MTVRLGILALLEAKPGKGDELGRLPREPAARSPSPKQGTVTWYAFKISDTSYGIFDTFETDDARQAHLDGADPARPSPRSAPDLLAADPDIRTDRHHRRQMSAPGDRTVQAHTRSPALTSTTMELPDGASRHWHSGAYWHEG